MPVHVAVRALLGQRGFQRFAAKWTRSSCFYGIRSSRVQNPDFRPGHWTQRDCSQFVHRHHLAVFTNQFAQARFICLGEINKLGNANTTFGANRSSRGQFIYSQPDQLVLGICSRRCPHGILSERFKLQLPFALWKKCSGSCRESLFSVIRYRGASAEILKVCPEASLGSSAICQ